MAQDYVSRIGLSKAEGTDQTVAEMKRYIKDLEDANKLLGTEIKKANKGGAESIKPFKTQLKEAKGEVFALTQAWAKMDADTRKSEAGVELKQRLDQAKQSYADLVDMQADLNQEIKNMASDTKNFDALAQGAQVFGGILSTTASFMGAFASSTEEAAKMMNMAQGIQTALSTAISIGNALQHQSALMVGIRSAQEWLAAKATTAHAVAAEEENAALTENAVATEANAVAMESSVVATEASATAMESNVIATEAKVNAENANRIATSASTIAETANTTATTANTVAESSNTTATSANTVAQNTNKVAVAASTVTEVANTTATTANTTATVAATTATKSATIAQKAFNLVAKANPYVLLATAVIAVGSAIYAFAKKTSEATEEEKKHREEVEKHQKAFEDYKSEVASTASKLIASYKSLASSWQKLSNSHQQTQWIKDNQAQFKELGISINSIKDAEEIFVKRGDAVVASLIARAKASAYATLAEKKYAEALTKQMDLEAHAVRVGDDYSKLSPSQKAAVGRMDRSNPNVQYIGGAIGSEGSGYWAVTGSGAAQANKIAYDASGINDILTQGDDLIRQSQSFMSQAKALLGDYAYTPKSTSTSSTTSKQDSTKSKEDLIKEAEQKYKIEVANAEEKYKSSGNKSEYQSSLMKALESLIQVYETNSHIIGKNGEVVGNLTSKEQERLDALRKDLTSKKLENFPQVSSNYDARVADIQQRQSNGYSGVQQSTQELVSARLALMDYIKDLARQLGGFEKLPEDIKKKFKEITVPDFTELSTTDFKELSQVRDTFNQYINKLIQDLGGFDKLPEEIKKKFKEITVPDFTEISASDFKGLGQAKDILIESINKLAQYLGGFDKLPEEIKKKFTEISAPIFTSVAPKIELSANPDEKAFKQEEARVQATIEARNKLIDALKSEIDRLNGVADVPEEFKDALEKLLQANKEDASRIAQANFDNQVKTATKPVQHDFTETISSDTIKRNEGLDDLITQYRELKQVIEDAREASLDGIEIDTSKAVGQLERMKSSIQSTVSADEAHQKTLTKMQTNVSGTANALQGLGQAFSNIAEEGAAAKAGAVLAAVGSIIAGFASAMASPATTIQGIWGWIAGSISGLATITGLIATMQKFSTGGVVQGNSLMGATGDGVIARLNPGELVLNGSQQKKLFDVLNGTSSLSTGGGVRQVEFVIKGQNLRGVLKNNDSKYSKLN